MTEEKFTYDINEETGLPDLPEGYWWRVGEGEAPSRWGLILGAPMVKIMTRGDVVVHKLTDVYGSHWWNKHKVVSKESVPVQEEGDVVHMYHTYSGFEWPATRKSEIPEFAFRLEEYTPSWSDKPYISFDVPLTEEATLFIADVLIQRLLRSLKQEADREEAARIRQENKDRLFGDYPPKKLVSA